MVLIAIELSWNMARAVFWFLALLAAEVFSWPHDPRELEYNLNTNEDTQDPMQYSGKWQGHNYTASPKNWRFPFYSL